TTNENGFYFFENLPVDSSYTITATANTREVTRSERIEGINVTDLVILARHLSPDGPSLDNLAAYIAGDINQDQSISLIDLVFIQQYILLGEDSLGAGNPLWRFYVNGSEFNPNDGFPSPDTSYQLDGISESRDDLDFVGVKGGDVNGSGNQ
ncbi:MAG: hypothetical protein AAF828_06160, partial [Bacteroidota bacterium]